MSEFDRLESSDKYTRIRAADALGNVRTKAALRALLDAARNDPEKDVRKAALDSIEKLRDPEALKTLEKIASDDKDRGTRSKAKDVIKTIETSGRELPESETFSERDADRSRRDARALEEHEAGQAGLYVKLQESLKYRINHDNQLVDEDGEELESFTGSGKVEIVNTGKKDRIWAIDAILKDLDNVTFEADEEQGTAVFGNSFALKELNPQTSKYVPFEFSMEVPKLLLKEDFWDLDKEDSPPLFARGTETGMRFTIELTNEFEWPIKDVVVKKYILDEGTSVSDMNAEEGSLRKDSDEIGEFISWTIEDIDPGASVKASCKMSVTLPEETNDPYTIGDTVITYRTSDQSLSGLGLDTITGSSSVFQFISRDEQEENPGDFDCTFELENTSEFEMDLKEIRIYEGDIEDGNVRLEWLGKDFPEEERSIDAGETFTLDPWTITVEDEDTIPQFGREIDLSVKYLYDAEVIAECVLPGYPLPFLGIEVTKSFDPLMIPSFRQTEVITEQVIKSVGSTEVEYLQVQDTIPEGFEGPTKDQVEIMKGDIQLTDFEFEVTGEKIIISMEHLEESDIGVLEQEEELIVKYPLLATAKPDEEFMGYVKVLGNIYPEVKPIIAEAEAGPITVVHKRRKIKIGKMVRSTASEDANEYEIVIRGENDGSAVIKNVEISDFLPAGFELVSETEEEPAVGYEEHSSVNNGRAMKWIYEEVQPGEKVQIRFKIRAPGEHDPKDVYRMLLG